MATVGAEDLLKKYGSPLGVARAILKDELSPHEQEFAKEASGYFFVEVAVAQLAMERETPLEKRLAELEERLERMEKRALGLYRSED